MPCPACRSGDLVRVDLAPRGEALRFSTCRACEHRWWATPQDVTIALDEVLEAVAAP